jgi:hypothetical protein
LREIFLNKRLGSTTVNLVLCGEILLFIDFMPSQKPAKPHPSEQDLLTPNLAVQTLPHKIALLWPRSHTQKNIIEGLDYRKIY